MPQVVLGEAPRIGHAAESATSPDFEILSAAPEAGPARAPKTPPGDTGVSRMRASLTHYLSRVGDELLASAIIPVSVRGKIMRRLGFKIPPGTCLWSGASLRSRRIEFGSRVFINVGFFYDGADDVVIGDNVRMGQFVRLITATHEVGPSHQRCRIDALTKPIRIEDGCWIGACVTILPGVTVQRGCVVAAGAVVTSSTEPDGLYAGVPARRVKDLP